MSAAAPALTPLLAACGGSPHKTTLPTGIPRTLAEMRQQLREVVAELAPKHAQVSALVTSSSRGGAAVDAQERAANRSKSAALVLVVSDGTTRFEHATTDLRPVGIERALRALESQASPSVGAAAAFGTPRDYQAKTEIDPASQTPQQWLERVEALHQRAARVGGSRVVYRGSYLTVDDTETLFISKDRDLRQRIVRTRGGVLLVAWTGSAPTVDDASRSGTIGLEALEVGSDELEQAADRALSLLTARPAPSGTRDVVVDPTITALVAHECLGDVFAGDLGAPLRARAQDRLGSELVTLVDDPSLVGGFGSYFFDDEGEAAARTVLVEAGQLRAPISDVASARALGGASP
jgi:predicted Zn-dependent protease